MSTCLATSPYTVNLALNERDKLQYTVEPGSSGSKEQVVQKIQELGWPNPYDNTDIQTFMEADDMDSARCFTDPDTTLRVIDNCYINKSCHPEPTGKVLDIHCDQSLPHDVSSVAIELDTPIPIVEHMNMSHIMGDQPDFETNDTGVVRCQEGYVFSQLEHSMDTDREYATAHWVKEDSSLWWLKSSMGPDTITNHELSGECVPDKCTEITIPDSSTHAYDPLVGGHSDEPVPVTCNDGYIFNHDLLHQGGKVKCDYDLKGVNDPLLEPNTMSWYIHDDRLDAMCNRYETEGSCIGSDIEPVPTYDPYQFLNTVSGERKNGLYNFERDTLHGSSGIPIGCQWSPELTIGEFTKPAQCKFRKKVDHENLQEPVCRPVYCPEKSIPNSNRSGSGTHNPLPGPRNESVSTGECLTSTGEIIDVNNVQDCLCQQHMSCNSCSTDDNCQWCGSREEDPSVVPGCYNKDTIEPICSSGIIRQSGATCNLTDPGQEEHIEKPGWSSYSDQEKNLAQCEDTFDCMNDLTHDIVPEQSIGTSDNSIEDISVNNQLNTGSIPQTDRDLCVSYNNNWSATTESSTSNDAYCHFKKRKVLNTPAYRVSGQDLYFPLWDAATEGDPIPKLSTTPDYCRSIEEGVESSCYTHKSYDTCMADTSCTYESNLLSEPIIHWSGDQYSYRDIIRITGTNEGSCFICDNNKLSGTASAGTSCEAITETGLTQYYRASRSDDSYDTNYVDLQTLDGQQVEIDPSVQGNCHIQYMDTSTLGANNAYNIHSGLLRQIGGDPLLMDDAINCIKPEGSLFKDEGYRYCASDSCGENDVPIRSPLLPAGSCHSDTCTDKRCYRNEGSREDVLITNQMAQDISSLVGENEFYSLSGKELSYTSTDYKERICGETFNQLDTDAIGSEHYTDKHFARCLLQNEEQGNIYNKPACDIINKQLGGEDTVHWGRLCRERYGTNKVPLKHVCESLGEDYEWRDALDANTNTWRGICYDITDPNVPVPLEDTFVCENKAVPSEQFYEADRYDQCIISVPTNIDTSQISSICEQWSAPGFESDNSFEFHLKPDDILAGHRSNRVGSCVLGDGRDHSIESGNTGRQTRDECERDNNTYVKKYTYDDSSACDINEINYQHDQHLTWTGGELQTDEDGEWVSECSAGILSSCQVTCDPNFGGGGMYTCHYNNHSDDVCQHIQDTFDSIPDTDTQRTRCEHYPNCTYTEDENPTCESVAVPGDDIIKGQAEWLGPECYRLNNDAFSHGIYNLSKLNDVFPPLTRLLFFFAIVLVFAYLIRKSRIYEGLFRFTAWSLDNGVRRIGTGTTKILYDIYYGSRNAVTNIKKYGIKTPVILAKHMLEYITKHPFHAAIAGTILYILIIHNPLSGYNVSDIGDDIDEQVDSTQNTLVPEAFQKYIGVQRIVAALLFLFLIRLIITKQTN